MNNKKKLIIGMLPHWSPMEPPVGLACLKSYVEQFDYTVIIKDYNIELYHEIYNSHRELFDDHFHQHWFSDEDYNRDVLPVIDDYIKKWAEEIAHSDAGIVGFSIYTSNLQTTLSVIKLIKNLNPEIIVILGAAEASTAFDYRVKEDLILYTDYLVLNEGEEILKNLADCINNNGDIKKVKGICYKKNNKFEFTGKAPAIKDINELPIPSIEHFPLDYYENLMIPIIGSRGCINKCSFCSEYPILGRYRSKTGERIYKEFLYYINTIGLKNLRFDLIDSLINGNIKELVNFCDLMIENNIKNRYGIEWSGKAAIRKGMTYEVLTKIAGAGCTYIYFGLESASANVLKDMNKKFDLDLASQIIKDSYKTGMNTRIFLVIGFPTESEEDFQKTLDFISNHSKYIENVFAGEGCCVAPTTDIYENPDKYGIYWKDGDWYSKHTSPEIRKDRIKRIRNHCKSLHMRIEGWGKPEE